MYCDYKNWIKEFHQFESKFLKGNKMSVRRLKSSKPEIQKKEDDIKVKTMVETTLQDVEKRGDNAVRELSLKFDKYNYILFSPGGESFDSYQNYLDRGKHFNQLIKRKL